MKLQHKVFVIAIISFGLFFNHYLLSAKLKGKKFEGINHITSSATFVALNEKVPLIPEGKEGIELKWREKSFEASSGILATILASIIIFFTLVVQLKAIPRIFIWKRIRSDKWILFFCSSLFFTFIFNMLFMTIVKPINSLSYITCFILFCISLLGLFDITRRLLFYLHTIKYIKPLTESLSNSIENGQQYTSIGIDLYEISDSALSGKESQVALLVAREIRTSFIHDIIHNTSSRSKRVKTLHILLINSSSNAYRNGLAVLADDILEELQRGINDLLVEKEGEIVKCGLQLFNELVSTATYYSYQADSFEQFLVRIIFSKSIPNIFRFVLDKNIDLVPELFSKYKYGLSHLIVNKNWDIIYIATLHHSNLGYLFNKIKYRKKLDETKNEFLQSSFFAITTMKHLIAETKESSIGRRIEESIFRVFIGILSLKKWMCYEQNLPFLLHSVKVYEDITNRDMSYFFRNQLKKSTLLHVNFLTKIKITQSNREYFLEIWSKLPAVTFRILFNADIFQGELGNSITALSQLLKKLIQIKNEEMRELSLKNIVKEINKFLRERTGNDPLKFNENIFAVLYTSIFYCYVIGKNSSANHIWLAYESNLKAKEINDIQLLYNLMSSDQTFHFTMSNEDFTQKMTEFKKYLSNLK